jgi:CYTH domain-containing protein/thymidylate kinase
MENDIKRIVLTGGPCAGKTTALVRIAEYFSGYGFKVFTVPEVPTLYSLGGWNYLTPNRRLYYEGELAILRTQLALEDSFMQLASVCTKPSIVVCDRGTLDISAYMTADMWADITSKLDTCSDKLRSRYDAVLHMVSAADGAEQYYTTATNATRYEQMTEEGLRMARTLDKKVMQAWSGHPHLCVVNNHDNFEHKLNSVVEEISRVVGLPLPVSQERMYRVEVTGELPDTIESDITQTYLSSDPGTVVRLRRRSWAGTVVNVHKTLKRTANGEEIVTERQVGNALYESLLQQADPYRQTIRKRRNSFIWKGQYFALDTYLGSHSGLVMLQTNGVAQGEEVNFPPFIRVVEDITANPAYFNHNLALRR